MILQEYEKPMTAMPRDDGDVGDPHQPDLAPGSSSMPDLLAALDQARHQVLAARDSYLKLRRLVNLRIEEENRWKRLEQIARRGPLRPDEDDAHANATAAEAHADLCRLNQELNDNVLCL